MRHEAKSKFEKKVLKISSLEVNELVREPRTDKIENEIRKNTSLEELGER